MTEGSEVTSASGARDLTRPAAPAATRAGRPRAGAPTPTGSCALDWDDSPTPAWGTAAVAAFFVALEQRGPWGHSAFTRSGLDPVVGASLENGCADAGGRALLIRAPGRAASEPDRQVYVSGGMCQGRPWLLGGRIEAPEDVLRIPFAAVAAGDRDAVLAALPALSPVTESVLLVCAHSKRDVCCAVRGRPVAAHAAERHGGRAWECSHTGGHRFAATAVLLPSGATLARLDDDLTHAALAAPADALAPALLRPRLLRGLAHLSLVEQAADAYVRERTGTTGVNALSTHVVADGPDGAHVRVEHRDGGHWQVLVTRETEPVARVNSCGGLPEPTSVFAVRELG